MSLLFDELVRVQTAFTFYDANLDNSDTALLGPFLWDQLTFNENHDEVLYISLSSLSSAAITCSARRDSSAQGGLAIPREWLSNHKHIFGSAHHVVVTRTLPVLLTEVYVSALSSAAYDAAIAHEALLESFLCENKRILRQGSIYSINLDALTESPAKYRLEFRIDMLEPVVQGYAEAGSTSFIVTSSADADEEEIDTLALSSDDESVEINQDFLANSVVYPSYTSKLPSLSSPRDDTRAEGDFLLEAHSLSSPVSILHDDHTVYLRTADLGRLGYLVATGWLRAALETSILD